MINKIRFRDFLLLFLYFLSFDVNAINLDKGTTITDENLTSLAATSWEYSISSTSQDSQNERGYNVAFYRINGSNELYSLTSSKTLYLSDFEKKKYAKHWPLTRWPYQYYSPDIAALYKELHHPYPLPFDYETTGPGPGCLGNSPLRYGDFDGDGSPNELVVFLDGLLIVFSTQYNRIVFSEPLDESDWMTKDEMNQFFDGKPIERFQYVSQVMADNDTIDAGIRAYAKLYFGDFDKDGNRDILAWRKSYRSKAGDDQATGFTKLRDVYQHFERDLKAQGSLQAGVTGEYLPQETEQDTIKQWLAENTLTWQKGYPAKSECQGSEGQIIPEMHDPLLNDPDVLK